MRPAACSDSLKAPPAAPPGESVPCPHPQLANLLAAAVYTCDLEGRLTYFNQAAADLWGRRPELGTELWCGSLRIFTPDGDPLPLESCPMATAIKEGTDVRGAEILIERPDGTRRHVVPHPQLIRDDSGRVVGAVNLLVDVTEQREARRVKALLAAIVDSSDDAIISKTLEGRITSWNAGAQRIFGYTAQEIVGRSVTTLIPTELLDEEPAILARLRRGERIEHFETIRVAKDGRRINISLSISPVRDGSGRLIGASKIARDITEQVRAKAAIAESEAKLRTLLSLLPVGVYACDPEGRLTFFNRRAVEMWGEVPDPLSVKHCAFRRVYLPDGAPVPPDQTPMAIALEEGRSFRDFEAIAERRDGSKFHASINIDPIYDEDGRFRGALNVFQDISVAVAARETLKNQSKALEDAIAVRTAELEETNRRLRQSERMAALGTLSAGIGHDLGNLLVPIRVSLESLAAAGLPRELSSEVERIRTSAQYLLQLANGLRMMALDPCKPETAQPLQLSAWWADARAIVKNALPRSVTLEADVPEGLWVTISRPALTQIAFNLAQNAGEALGARPGGRVRITARQEDQSVLLSVEDNGPGMTQEVLTRCVEPFFTTKTRVISTGLGLVLVGGLVREAGGTLQIHSELGKGARFDITLPAPSIEDAAAKAARPRRLAVVELAEPRRRSWVTAELRHLGFEILPEPRGRQIDLLVTNDPAYRAAAQSNARHVILFADDGDHPRGVNAIGSSPKPDAIRQAIRAATREAAAPEAPA